MNKKMILIVILILFIIIFGCIVLKKVKNKNTSNSYSYEIKTEKERQESRKDGIEEKEEILRDGGIKLTNKKECRDTVLDEEGYSYQVDGQTIEIYNLDGVKLENLITRDGETNEVKVKTQNGLNIAICFNNMLILNADKNLRNKILNALQEI